MIFSGELFLHILHVNDKIWSGKWFCIGWLHSNAWFLITSWNFNSPSIEFNDWTFVEAWDTCPSFNAGTCQWNAPAPIVTRFDVLTINIYLLWRSEEEVEFTSNIQVSHRIKMLVFTYLCAAKRLMTRVLAMWDEPESRIERSDPQSKDSRATKSDRIFIYRKKIRSMPRLSVGLTIIL